MTTTDTAAYRAMSAAELRRVLLVEYRCARGCLLLHVFASPDGPRYYRPALRVSDSMRTRTGIAEPTRIPEAAGLLAELSSEQWVWGDAENAVHIGCRHCIGLRFPAASVKADAAAATPGNPVRNHSFWMTPDPPA